MSGAAKGSTLLRIATRQSPLALAQTRWVGARVREHFPEVEIEEVQIVTEGDRVLDKPLAKIGGKGLFVSEVEAALGDGRADIAVHSVKDIPEAIAPGMALICIPEREDPRDVLVTPEGDELMALTAGSRVGTSSLRRAVQIRRARNDLAFGVLRGNVGTRLGRLDEGRFAAIVLAYAGMKRLGLDAERKLWALPPEICVPAVGQGALAIEARDDDARVGRWLAPLEHTDTRIAVECERAFLQTLHGSCSTPLGCYARIEGESLTVDGMVGSLDGDTVLRSGTSDRLGRQENRASHARDMGHALAEELLREGAAKLIEESKAAADPYAYLY